MWGKKKIQLYYRASSAATFLNYYNLATSCLYLTLQIHRENLTNKSWHFSELSAPGMNRIQDRGQEYLSSIYCSMCKGNFVLSYYTWTSIKKSDNLAGVACSGWSSLAGVACSGWSSLATHTLRMLPYTHGTLYVHISGGPHMFGDGVLKQ